MVTSNSNCPNNSATFLQNYYVYSFLPDLHIALGIHQIFSFEYQKPNN